MPIKTYDIDLDVGGRSARAYLAEPENGGPGILLLHAWWGLKPFFRQVCDRLAGKGYVVLAPDLHEGHVAATVDEAQELMDKGDRHFRGEVVTTATDYLLKLPERKGPKIGVMGFSMGAAWALSVAAERPDVVGTTVMFYGAGQEDLGRVKSAVLGHFSDVDEWESYEYVLQMEEAMKDVGLDVQFHVYPGLAHWFVEEDRPEYVPEAADLAWARTYEFLKKNLHA